MFGNILYIFMFGNNYCISVHPKKLFTSLAWMMVALGLRYEFYSKANQINYIHNTDPAIKPEDDTKSLDKEQAMIECTAHSSTTRLLKHRLSHFDASIIGEEWDGIVAILLPYSAVIWYVLFILSLHSLTHIHNIATDDAQKKRGMAEE